MMTFTVASDEFLGGGREKAEYSNVVQQLRRARGLPISIETVYGAYPRWDGRPHEPGMPPLAESRPHYRGQIAYGLNLIGVALTDRPAAACSVLWMVDR